MNAYNTDAQKQALTFFEGEAYRIHPTVYETQYPDWDFTRLVFVDTSGPEWSPGVITYTTDITGKANWQSGAAKDIPLVGVTQDRTLKTHHMAAVGYDYNIEELNTLLRMGAPLPARKAQAARTVYQKFMFEVALFGHTEKGLSGLTNYPGVTVVPAPADGTGTSRNWINSAGVGLKTPAQIVRDINLALSGVASSTFDVVLADTVLMPQEAYDYIAATPYSATTMETVLSFILRTNLYTIRTGRPLTIMPLRELGTAATDTTSPTSAGQGRLVAYNNAEQHVTLHLPMPHRFLPIYQDGPMNYMVPGIFRTGGVEVHTLKSMRYIDGISVSPA